MLTRSLAMKLFGTPTFRTTLSHLPNSFSLVRCWNTEWFFWAPSQVDFATPDTFLDHAGGSDYIPKPAAKLQRHIFFQFTVTNVSDHPPPILTANDPKPTAHGMFLVSGNNEEQVLRAAYICVIRDQQCTDLIICHGTFNKSTKKLCMCLHDDQLEVDVLVNLFPVSLRKTAPVQSENAVLHFYHRQVSQTSSRWESWQFHWIL